MTFLKNDTFYVKRKSKAEDQKCQVVVLIRGQVGPIERVRQNKGSREMR